VLDLAFNIDFTERCEPCVFKKVASLARKESKAIFTVFEKGLAFLIVNKLCRIAIGFKAKLLSYES
jgi:hypothetical protein